MARRFLWTIVGAALCAGAGTMALADAPDDWVCNLETKAKTKQHACDTAIAVRESRPKTDNEVRHLVREARFRINYDGSSVYSVKLLSKHWLLGFKDTKLRWHERLDNENNVVLMPDAVCQDLSDNAAKLLTAGKFTPPDFSYFVTTQGVPIHFKGNGLDVQVHDWLIYPIGDSPNGERDYCLMIPPDGADGGSHDGAVHGDS